VSSARTRLHAEASVHTKRLDAGRLRWTAIALAVGFALHGVDHVRRGMAAATVLVMIGGGAEAVSIAIAVVMVLTRRKWAAQTAVVVGFGTALASTYGHLLPTLLPGYQDSFVSLPHTGVTWFSWVSLAAAMGAGILFGFAGIWAARNRPPSGSDQPEGRQHP
jgi:hypothetical protein